MKTRSHQVLKFCQTTLAVAGLSLFFFLVGVDPELPDTSPSSIRLIGSPASAKDPEDILEDAMEDALEDQIEDQVEEDIEDQVEEDVEDQVEEDVEDDVEDSVEEKTEDRLEDQLEEQLADQLEAVSKLEKEIEENLEDALEDQLKIEKQIEDDLEDAVEEQIRAQKALNEDLEDALKAEVKQRDEDEEDRLDAQEEADKQREREEEDRRKEERDEQRDREDFLSKFSDFEQILDDNGHPALGGEVLILVDAEEADQALADGIEVEGRQDLESLGLVLLRVDTSDDIEGSTLIQSLTELIDGSTVDFNHLYTLDSEPTYRPEIAEDPKLHTPAALARSLGMHAPVQSSFAIGLIDSAINTDHACLRGAGIEQQSLVPEGAKETNAHGTAVASILLADESCGMEGLLSNTRLYSASIFFRTPQGIETATVKSLLLALDWLVSKKVPVINMSLSGPPNQLLHRAITKARTQGTIVVAAVGNAGPAAAPRYPAAYDEAIGVTAADVNNHVYRRAIRGNHVQFTAPGVDITVAGANGLTQRSGTSIAAPFVSAILFQALNNNPQDTSGDETVDQLRLNALDLGEQGFDTVFGYGLIQAVEMPTNPGKTSIVEN